MASDSVKQNQVCPLSGSHGSYHCLRERCAWFDDVTELCAILLLAQQLHGVATPEGGLIVVLEERADE